MFRKEVKFYELIAKDCPIRTPKAHYAKVAAGGQGTLVFEDLSLLKDATFSNPWVADDELATSVARCKNVITQLAAMHAKYWNSPRFDNDLKYFATQGKGLAGGSGNITIMHHFFYNNGWPKYKENGLFDNSGNMGQLGDMLLEKFPQLYMLMYNNVSFDGERLCLWREVALVSSMQAYGTNLIRGFALSPPLSLRALLPSLLLLLFFSLSLSLSLSPTLFPRPHPQAAAPRTLVHGDTGVYNMMFYEGEKMCLFDWQFCQAGNGIFDIAFFLSLSVGTKMLEDNEDEFLKLYHAELVKNGVKDYDEAQMRDDYKIGLATSWAIIVYVTSLLASKGPSWDEPIRIASQRTIKACERTGAVEHVLKLLA